MADHLRERVLPTLIAPSASTEDVGRNLLKKMSQYVKPLKTMSGVCLMMVCVNGYALLIV